MSHPWCKRKQSSLTRRRLPVEQQQSRPTGFHETRDTRHESRPFSRVLRPSGGEKCRLTPCSTSWRRSSRRKNGPSASVGRQVMLEGGRPAGFKGGGTKRGKTSGKRFFLNPETGITTFSESGFGSRFGIPHYPSEFVGKIRISPCRQPSAPEHCGNRVIGFMDVSRPRVTFPGPRVSPSGEVKCERVTNCESRLFSRRRAKKKFV